MARQARPRILIIEDDARTASSVRGYLQHQGFHAEVEREGPAGLERALAGRHDLVILDLMLPGMDGISVCRRLRRESDVPVLMLTARAFTGDRVEGLEAGADDYLPKPFSLKELTARVRAVLRRASRDGAAGPSMLRLGALEIDLQARRVLVAGEAAGLTATEFDILAVLARSPGRVFTREALIHRALGDHYEGQDRTVDVHVKNIRRKIEPDRDRPVYITTVFGVGYRCDVGEPPGLAEDPGLPPDGPSGRGPGGKG